MNKRPGIWVYLPVVIGALFFLVPLFWMFATSVKSYDQVFAFPPIWWPLHPHWSNYKELLSDLPFLRYTLNTVFVTAVTLVGYILSSSIVAFGFSYFKVPGKKALFTILLITLMLPPQVTMIPQYVLFNKLGWVGTFLPLIIPPFLGAHSRFSSSSSSLILCPRNFRMQQNWMGRTNGPYLPESTFLSPSRPLPPHRCSYSSGRGRIS